MVINSYRILKHCILNNGCFTKRIEMQRGIFQGCPLSPYLFLCCIDILAILIRSNPRIGGIPIENEELKISLFADDILYVTWMVRKAQWRSFLGHLNTSVKLLAARSICVSQKPFGYRIQEEL